MSEGMAGGRPSGTGERSPSELRCGEVVLLRRPVGETGSGKGAAEPVEPAVVGGVIGSASKRLSCRSNWGEPSWRDALGT